VMAPDRMSAAPLALMESLATIDGFVPPY
jgi:hypothetical protein